MRIVKGMKPICLVVICATLVLLYAFRVEPYLLVVKHHLLGINDPKESIRIVQVSDIQISEDYTVHNLVKLVKKINAQRPDIFIFTGDLFENYAAYGPEQEVMEALSAIKTTYGKFAVWGNRDYGGGAVRYYERILESAGFILLQNSDIMLTTNENQTVWIGGLDDYLLGKPDIEMLLAGMQKEADYRILLTHEPDTADFYKDCPLDLILAGHSHGGQVHIPFWKGITTAMADHYTAGFYNLGNEFNTLLYVNTGIGTSHYSIRLGVPPEITVFDIGLS